MFVKSFLCFEVEDVQSIMFIETMVLCRSGVSVMLYQGCRFLCRPNVK